MRPHLRREGIRTIRRSAKSWRCRKDGYVARHGASKILQLSDAANELAEDPGRFRPDDGIDGVLAAVAAGAEQKAGHGRFCRSALHQFRNRYAEHGRIRIELVRIR
jgi:hypothetical protein